MLAAHRIWVASLLAALLLFSVPASSYRITDGPTEIEAAVLALRNIVHEVIDSGDRMGDVRVCAHFATKDGLRDFPQWLLGETAKTPWLLTDCLQHRAASWNFPIVSCGLEMTGFGAQIAGMVAAECWIGPPDPNGLEGVVFGFQVSRKPTLEFQVVRTYRAIA
jgi:hypothetical protein